MPNSRIITVLLVGLDANRPLAAMITGSIECGYAKSDRRANAPSSDTEGKPKAGHPAIFIRQRPDVSRHIQVSDSA
jgi:hypothetical protein